MQLVSMGVRKGLGCVAVRMGVGMIGNAPGDYGLNAPGDYGLNSHILRTSIRLMIGSAPGDYGLNAPGDYGLIHSSYGHQFG